MTYDEVEKAIIKDQVLAKMHFALCSIENNKKLSSVVNTESLINS